MIKTVGVLGAGTMGCAVATAFAAGGYPVRVVEINTQRRKAIREEIAAQLDLYVENGLMAIGETTAAMQRLSCYSSYEEGLRDVDFLIENIPELLELKQTTFLRLDRICKPETIFASNTSGLKLSEIALHVSPQRRKRMLITQWMYPAHVVPIVEVTVYGGVSQEIVEEVETMYRNIGKRTIRILKEVPGLVVSRIDQVIAREAFHLVEDGVVSMKDVDAAVQYGVGFRLSAAGPCAVADLSGLDILGTTASHVLADTCVDPGLSKILGALLSEGKSGVKSGEGFYSYFDDNTEHYNKVYLSKLMQQLKLLNIESKTPI